MDRLRPRRREVFSGFTDAEIEKMEKLLEKSREETCNKEFCQKIAISFNRSAGRAGKPLIKWTEVQSWFKKRQQEHPKVIFAPNSGKNESEIPANCSTDKTNENSQTPKAGQKITDSSELEFEAKSSTDGAWYDVDMFLGHRFLGSGEAEVLVRFVGFGAEEDEWINVKKGIRQRSVPLENSECDKVKVGDLLLCFQERRDHAIYYDAHVIGIQRRMHDIRGCRCLFLIRYDHDNTEERVRLRRLCWTLI
ncbi:protein SAWADEE HOMEODOMAIN HOMOLOG 1-like isoform X1 [Rhodamnia argentea]|uniref:Protein SAWADEE HOMEODOMAIN HOMOLOG 1-like isoform X1 n=1 Tax=Rhodamnia argentea TaxID=178133 RepID=A0A8B8MSB5_9MYRT|nr:protein SAWADEE HOMEODOMAIN HOMOLOG 1-like isoform X1 [Rhodamnia argentea]